jgi:hypothetical protein
MCLCLHSDAFFEHSLAFHLRQGSLSWYLFFFPFLVAVQVLWPPAPRRLSQYRQSSSMLSVSKRLQLSPTQAHIPLSRLMITVWFVGAVAANSLRTHFPYCWNLAYQCGKMNATASLYAPQVMNQSLDILITFEGLVTSNLTSIHLIILVSQ